MSFDWKTDEEHDWPDEPERPSPPETAAPRRTWPFLLAAVIGLALVGWVIYRQAQQQAAAVSERVSDEVAAAHRLVADAAQRRDVELFRSVLSGRDPAWTEVQTELVAQGDWLDRSGLGLIRAADAGTVLTTTVAPALDAAALTFAQEYETITPQMVTETVTLRHTAVYRRGANKWLYAPPARDFWGAWLIERGDRLTAGFPARDVAIARRLAVDLDDLLVDLCRTPKLDCPPDWRVNLRFDDDVETLLALADFEQIVTGGVQLALPTPTLVGLPVDEAGYEALRRGYGANLVTAVMPQLTGYDCCTHGPFFRVLLEKQLSRLGLRPWPLTPARYAEAIHQWGGTTLLSELWASTSLERPPLPLYTLIDFVLAWRETAVSPLDLQRRLVMSSDHFQWIQQTIGGTLPASQFENTWLAFVYSQSESKQQASPLPLPQQDVRLVCRTTDPQANSLFRYDWQTEQWISDAVYELEDTRYGALLPFPEEDGFLLQQSQRSGVDSPEYTWTLTWRGERLMRFAGVQQIFAASVDPNKRYAQMAIADWTNYDLRYELIDLQSCDGEQCRRIMLDGFVSWSPDGRSTLLLMDPQVWQSPFAAWRRSIVVADEVGNDGVTVGEGAPPQWVSDEQFAYVRLAPEADDPVMELVTATTTSHEPKSVIGAEAIRPLLPDFVQERTLYLDLVGQASSGELLLRVRTTPQATAFSYYVAVPMVENATPRLVQEVGRPNVPRLSPNGRWLTLWLFDETMAEIVSVELVDVVTGERQQYAVHANNVAWSADGNWLAYNDNGHLTVVAPAYQYQQLIFHDYHNCRQIDWVRK